MEGWSLGKYAVYWEDKTHIYRKMQIQTTAVNPAVLDTMMQPSGNTEEKQRVGKLGGERAIGGAVWKWVVVEAN